MTDKKVYAVVLNEQLVEDLKDITSSWLKKSNNNKYYYIYAKSINPNGNYFHMTLEQKTPNNELVEFELQLPHSCIKAVFYSADIRKIGFV